jgi:hypothetical protein
MLDESSMVFYTVDKSYNGKEICMAEKMNRCMFFVNMNGSVIVQARVYPDGRDGGDNSLSKKFREIVQKIIAECYGLNNYWDLKKGSYECGQMTETDDESCHYKDYIEYDDVTVSINKDEKIYKEIVYIGHAPMCIKCGEEYENNEELHCEYCEKERVRCERCGELIDVEDAIYCEDNECYYCDSECAEYDEVYYCEDDGNYHTTSNCYLDDHNGYYYHDEPEVMTEDGKRFHSEDAAYEEGYERCVWSGEWYKKEELVEDALTGEYFSIEECENYEYINGKYYMSESNAESDGYTKNEDGDWVRMEEIA